MNKISAYVLRWDAVSLTTATHQPVRFTEASLRRWLDEDAPSGLPMLVNHRGPEVGRWGGFEVDEVGLLAHGYLYRTPAAQKVTFEIQTDQVTTCSIRARLDGFAVAPGVGPSDVADVADLVEAGPCHDPADPGAVIVSFDRRQLRTGEPYVAPSFIDQFSQVLGGTDAKPRRGRAYVQQVDVERLALELKRLRTAAAGARRAAAGPRGRPQDDSWCRELERLAGQTDAALRQLIRGDAVLLADVYERFGIRPPAMAA